MTWIQTYPTGTKFNLADPQPGMINLEDIAHALGHLCRFNGHISRHYSVAQHSYLVSILATEEHAAVALMHDAAEAYYGEVIRPLKQLLPEYKRLEALGWKVIATRFSLPTVMPMEIKNYDMIALATEREQLCVPDPEPWGCLEGVKPLEFTLPAWDQDKATEMFLERAAELGIR